jgi:hypothetical protein
MVVVVIVVGHVGEFATKELEGVRNAITRLSAASMTIATSLTLISAYLLVSRLRSVAFSLSKGNIEWERRCLRLAVCSIRVEREGFTLMIVRQAATLAFKYPLVWGCSTRQQLEPIFNCNDDIRKPNLVSTTKFQCHAVLRTPKSLRVVSFKFAVPFEFSVLRVSRRMRQPTILWIQWIPICFFKFVRGNYPIEIYIVIYSTYRLNICHQLFDVDRSYY